MAKGCDGVREDAIGGYFQLELRKGEHYHKDALKLNTARNSFEYILLARKYRKVYIPYYTCEVMLQPLEKNHIEHEFYSINIDFEPVETKTLKPDEAFLYTNYFGLKQDCVKRLSEVYGSQLIVDNAQAFYAPRIEGIDTFYSARKFFGVADGAYLYTDCLLNKEFQKDKSYMRMQHLLQRIDDGAEAGYKAFKVNDGGLDNQPIMKMSKLTESILSGVDYRVIAEIRKKNFKYLHSQLSETNKLTLTIDEDAVPMIYPYMTECGSFRQRLIDSKIFVAQYWPNVIDWCDYTSKEYYLSTHVLSLPIDQRYGIEEINRVVDVLCNMELKES